MPTFNPGSSHTGTVQLTVTPSGLLCPAELFLSSDGGVTKAATSGQISFTSTGSLQSISLPITVPSVAGTYSVFLNVLNVLYQSPDNVVISSAPSPVPYPIPGSLPWITNQVGEYGGVVAFPYYSGGWKLHIEDSSGPHDYSVPEPSLGDVVKVVVVSPSEIWISFTDTSVPNKPITANRYEISNGVMTRVSSDGFGSNQNVIVNGVFTRYTAYLLGFIRLASGMLVLAWQQFDPYDPAFTMKVGFAYNTGSGFVTMPYAYFATSNGIGATLVQHPGDRSVWLFAVHDGAGLIRAMHLSENAGTLKLDWIDNNFVPTYNALSPEGEWPWIVATPDPTSNSIILAYQNSTYHFFSTSPPRKGAYINVVKIGADKSKTLLFVLQKWVERISPFDLGVSGGNPWLIYPEIDPVSLSYDNLYLARNNGTDIQYLGVLAGDGNSVYPAKNTLRLCNSQNWGIAQMNDGYIHFYEV
jgi:hypothetical protein